MLKDELQSLVEEAERREKAKVGKPWEEFVAQNVAAAIVKVKKAAERGDRSTVHELEGTPSEKSAVLLARDVAAALAKEGVHAERISKLREQFSRWRPWISMEF